MTDIPNLLMEIPNLYIVATLTFVALGYLVISLISGTTLSFRPFTLVRRKESPAEYWTLVGINGFAVALLALGTYNLLNESPVVLL
jgi:hypothetical protein